MGCGLSKGKAYGAEKKKEEEHEEEDYSDLLTPALVLRINRWLELVHISMPPGGWTDPEAAPPQVEDVDGASPTQSPTVAGDDSLTRLNSLTPVNMQHHQRLLQQQDRASGGAPLDGSFKIVATGPPPRPSGSRGEVGSGSGGTGGGATGTGASGGNHPSHHHSSHHKDGAKLDNSPQNGNGSVTNNAPMSPLPMAKRQQTTGELSVAASAGTENIPNVLSGGILSRQTSLAAQSNADEMTPTTGSGMGTFTNTAGGGAPPNPNAIRPSGVMSPNYNANKGKRGNLVMENGPTIEPRATSGDIDVDEVAS